VAGAIWPESLAKKTAKLRPFDTPTRGRYGTPTIDLFPDFATASTHHRRDEQSNADGNLTGLFAGGAAYGMARYGRP
jgi:hypothetical protein